MPMRFLAYLAIATFITISALVSARKEWFGFIYGFPGGDKFAHFFGMGLLTFFMVLGFSSLGTNNRPINPLASMAAAALLVTLDEVIQLAIPSRAFELKDLAWSLTGVLVFWISYSGDTMGWVSAQSEMKEGYGEHLNTRKLLEYSRLSKNDTFHFECNPAPAL